MTNSQRATEILKMAAPIGRDIRPDAPERIQAIVGLAAIVARTARSSAALDMFCDLARELSQRR